MSDTVTVVAPGRLHMGLFDLGEATSRTFGGLGIMIEEPNITVSGEEQAATTVDGGRISPRTRATVRTRIETLRKLNGAPPVGIHIQSCPPEHVGLGTKTALILASLKAAAECWGIRPSPQELQLPSSRGGTSGIGVSGFFTGGFLIDAGHLGKRPLVPSSAQNSLTIPPITVRLNFPTEWEITLLLPQGERLSGEREREFFERSTPTPPDEIYRQIAIAYHELTPAVAENNLDEFGKSLAKFISLGFKSREIRNQSPNVRQLLQTLSEQVPCVGMSSMGPLIYCITDGPMSDVALPPTDVQVIGKTKANNHGFRVKKCSI
jgi:beta-ribofuranosylaminobenzene 5'-phosphate synthase